MEKTAPPREASTKAGAAEAGVNPLLRLTLAWPKTVLAVALLFAVVAGFFGAGVISELKTGGVDDPGSESVLAREILAERFPHADPNLVVMVSKPDGGVEDPDVIETGRDLTHRIASTEGVAVGASYWDTPAPELRSRSGDAGLILIRVAGDEDEVADRTERLHDELARASGPVHVRFGGLAQVNNDLNAQAAADLAKAESVAIPLTLVLLLFVFGTVVAAGVPLLIGLLAIAGTLGALRAVAAITDVSVFSVNLATALGLGLAVDYSLLFVSRYREERRRQLDTRAALAATMRTAGRTIVFSASTVAVAMCCLLVFRLYFLRSFAYAGVAVVGVTLVGATVVLPALLALLGDRIDSWALPGRRNRGGARATAFWGRVAALIVRRPVLTAAPVVALLLVLCSPFSHVQFGIADDRVLQSSAESREVADHMRADFAVTNSGSLAVVGEPWGQTPEDTGAIAEYGKRLSLVSGVVRVDSAAGSFVRGAEVGSPVPSGARFRSGNATWFSVLSEVEPYSSEGGKLARDVRAVGVPDDRPVRVTGPAAQLVDMTKSIADRLPLALALIALTTFLLLFLMTGSLLLPVSALVFNVLGLVAVFGASVWVFQDGHLADLLEFTPTPLAVAIPVLLFCAVFGLSTDYQVFVVASVKERRDGGADVNTAVIQGLSRSAPVISAAAAVLCVSFLAMLSSRVSVIQLLGFGASVAVLLDAFLIRPVLVSALMRLAGRWSWWAPKPLRLLNRAGLDERHR